LIAEPVGRLAQANTLGLWVCENVRRLALGEKISRFRAGKDSG